MESANSHHHHQDQLLGSSLPNYATPWPPSSFLNSNCLSETKQQANSSHTSMEMGFSNWSNNHSDQDLQHYYRKYSDILSCGGGGSGGEEQTLRNQHQQQHSSDLHQNDVATKFLLKSFSSYGKMNSPDFYSGNSVNHTRQIFPAEYSSLINPAPGSLDMNLEALDLLASSRFTANFPAAAASHSQIGILRDEFSSYGLDQMHQSLQIPFYGSNKVSSASSNGVVTEAKRNTNKMEPKSLIQKPPKKSRLEARSSSIPPFKVRKEKLGDRIAALQQMVAPFGKTDTASVLMEAIGYIKFLQTQVETLSVPYMKASRNKTNRVTKGGAVAENGNYEEAKGDLKSRGLCLVPLSCLSYITDGGGGGGAAVWPPPHFGGAT